MIIAVVFLCLVSYVNSAPRAFQHPGVLISKTQLDFIKAQVSQKVDPIYSAYQKAVASSFASKTYKTKGPPPGGIIDCGSYSNPNIGCSDADDDGSAALLQAVLWYITGDNEYSKNSISIMNHYASNLKGHNNSNAPLQTGWDCQKWPAAGEIIRYSNAGWSDSEITAYSNMLKNVNLPEIIDGSKSNGNWEISMIDGMIGIAVFSEDEDLYNHAVTFWKQRIPAYFYYHTDGDHPVPAPRGNPSWYGQKVYNSSVDGVAQETCRDLGHTAYGIAGATHAAETAYIQGDTLYENEKDRLAATLEFHANLCLAGSTKVPADICDGTIKLGAGPTFVIGYNQLHNRLGMSLPKTEEWITKHIETEASPLDAHMMVFETLTHGSNAPGA